MYLYISIHMNVNIPMSYIYVSMYNFEINTQMYLL